MNSNLPKWMTMTKGGSRTSAYSAEKPVSKSKKRKVTRRKIQIERQTQGKVGNKY